MKVKITILQLLGVICLSVSLPLVPEDTLKVSTPSGDVLGIGVPVIGLKNAKTYQFRKIPYAQAPLGTLRFAKPQPYGKWKGVLDATKFGPSCMQQLSALNKAFLPNKTLSEDCLFLNIYVPNGVDRTQKKAVMVWIHGGGYQTGQGMLYESSYMSAKADVIVVTINYRLGFFGFLTLQNEIIKGNYGLWDQILALKWVKSNIEAFGGDSESITIFGESAGGFSVALLSLIPTNKGLFHRVIAQSGVATSFDAIAPIGPLVTYTIGKEVGCPLANPDSFLGCIRLRSADQIQNATEVVEKTEFPVIHLRIGLGPVVDRELFHESPASLLSNRSSEAFAFFQSLDFIAGNVNSEGSLIIPRFTPDEQKRDHFSILNGVPYTVFCNDISPTLSADYYHNNSKVAGAICQQYGVQDSNEEQGRQAVNFYTDLFFLSRTVSTLRSHTHGNSNTSRYQYLFTRSKGPFAAPEPSWFEGTPHASELLYLFGLRNVAAAIHYAVPQVDLDLSDEMVTYWTNFAKSGNPNGEGDGAAVGVTWPPYDLDTEAYIQLDTTVNTGTKYKAARVKFWLEDIPSMLNNTMT